jgi:iron(III) transport system substrate-binding protein
MVMTHRTGILAAAMGAAALAMAAVPAGAAELPKSTRSILEELKLSESILSGLDRELAMPEGWVEKARQEGEVVIISSWDPRQFRDLVRPFQERFPFIKLNYSRASYNARVIKPLIAFKEGRYITDILTGYNNSYELFEEANALEDLSDIPNYKLLPEGMHDPKHKWLGQRLRYWCMSYNTDKVKKADLPKTWDDLLTKTRFFNGKIAVANRAELWLAMLYGAKGEAWLANFARRLVGEVRPQLRKEGTNALISLVIAGEFDIAIPSAAYRVKQYVDKKAPIGWHCPEPVPMAVSGLGMLKGAPHLHAAKVFANWFLSKEGQISQFAADGAPPIHPQLQTREFLAFPDEILGKKIAFRKAEVIADAERLHAIWDPIWKKGSGEDKMKLLKFTTRLEGTKGNGARVTYKREGKAEEVGVSGSRTKLTVNGESTSRRNLKAGMTCEITMLEGAREAQAMSCK